MVFLYAFVAVLCLGIAPFFGKSALNNISPLVAFAIRTTIAAILVLAWFIISKTSFELRNLPASFWITVTLEAALAAVLADLAYFYALQKGTISQVALLISCAPLVTVVIGFLIFDEVLSWNQIIGALFMTIGLIFINLDI